MTLLNETGGTTRGAGEERRDVAMLRALFDTIPGRAAFLDLDLRYSVVNREFLAAVDLAEEDVIGKRVSDIFGADEVEICRAAMPRLLEGGSFHSERWREDRDGRRRCFEETLRAFVPRSGVVLGFVSITRDLTDLKERERQLSESLKSEEEREAIHAAVVNSALDCIVVIDAEGHVVEFNPAAVATFGYSREEAIGRTVAQLIIPPELRERHTAGLKRFTSGGGSTVIGRRVELEAICANGSRIPIELAITAIGSSSKALFTAHLRDLRPAREASAEIERQREALYQSEKLSALGSLLAGVAHELNNPLSIVVGQALMLREAAQARAEREPQFKEFSDRSEKIENAANRCARIVRTFLAMARQREAQREEVTVSELIERVLDLLAYGLTTAGIEVVKDIPANLPVLWADSDQLHQVLLNLVVNAKQALEGQPAPRRILIVVRLDNSSNKIVVTISDNGPGIPEKIRTRIFEPFFTTKPQGVGTGIGLAISRGLIEAHDGALLLAPPQEGVGAAFIIELPLVPSPKAGKVESFETEQGTPVAKPRRRALVVDDEIEIASLLTEILLRLKFDCERASSGEQAKEILAARSGGFDLILCDLRMPNGDGPALYDWLCAEHPHLATRIAFVTGDVLGPAADRFLARSGCPVIAKPFVPDDIRQIVELLCDDAGAQAR